MLYVDALLSFVLPFLRVGLKVLSTGILLLEVLLSLDFVSELLPLFACCCWSSCCCWNSISFVSQMLDQIRLASPSCSSWYHATDKSILPKPGSIQTILSPLQQPSLSCTQNWMITVSLSDSAVSRFSQSKSKSPQIAHAEWNFFTMKMLLLAFRFYFSFYTFLKYSHRETLIKIIITKLLRSSFFTDANSF